MTKKSVLDHGEHCISVVVSVGSSRVFQVVSEPSAFPAVRTDEAHRVHDALLKSRVASIVSVQYKTCTRSLQRREIQLESVFCRSQESAGMHRSGRDSFVSSGSSDRLRADELLMPAEVARLFRVSAKTVFRWTQSGKLPVIYTPGGQRRFRLSQVEKALAEASLDVDAF
jgi:excisionase family DNA binding protein